jgi:formylglycine-generating enzyme required for sulfatase activity
MAWLNQTNAAWANDVTARAQRVAEIQRSLALDRDSPAAPVPLATRHSPAWYVNSQAQTLIVLPGPVTFTMGSPEREAGRHHDETQHAVRIGRSFALSATLVAVEQYQAYFRDRFHDDYQLPPKYTQSPRQPVVGIDWYMAADYCNWLSQQEHLQPCYEITGFNTNSFRGDVKLKENYLSLSGYRVPTEAEMDYATRAGTATSRYFGQTEELLPKYAWYAQDSGDNTHPIGLLKPNDFGLFDAHGNAWTLCQERYQPYFNGAEISDDREDDQLVVAGTEKRVMRGGAFNDAPSFVRSACRTFNVPADRSLTIGGFRAARTLPPVPLTPLPPAAP